MYSTARPIVKQSKRVLAVAQQQQQRAQSTSHGSKLDQHTKPIGGFSVVKGPTSTPLLRDTISKQFQRKVSDHSSDDALIIHRSEYFYGQEAVGRKISWTELDKLSNHFASGLLKLGYEKGDRFGICMVNNEQWIVAMLASAKLGLALVNLNPAYRRSELKHALNLVKCKGILIVPEYKTNFMSMLQELKNGGDVPTLEHIVFAGKPGERHTNAISYDDLVSTPIDHKTLAHLASIQHVHDTINIQFTSGTTGLPKASELTHMNILNNGYFVGERMNLSPADIVGIPVPLFHCFGTVIGYLAALTHGSKTMIPSMGFDAKATLEAVHKHRPTVLHGVPSMFISELEHEDISKFDLSSLRTGVMAGSICPETVMRQVMDKMHMKEVTICYGMTETSPVSFQSFTNDPIEKRCLSVGTVHDHLECKIIDPNTGHVVPVGETGELCTKGYSLMKGYYAQPEETKKAIDTDGFMHTGDLARMDPDGSVFIVGRNKDVIIRGGENIAPREVEDLLYLHPSIQDVAVVAVPHHLLGEEVAAFVIPKRGASDAELEQSIKEFCKGKIAHYKVPKFVFVVDKFPMTLSGKVQKYVLRDMAKQELKAKGKLEVGYGNV